MFSKMLIILLSVLSVISCSSLNTSISFSITGNHEDKYPFFETNQEIHNIYGLIYYPKYNKLYVSHYFFINL